MVSVDIYRNETTRHANVILPPEAVLARGHYDLALLPARGPQRRQLLAAASSSSSRARCPSGRSCCGSPRSWPARARTPTSARSTTSSSATSCDKAVQRDGSERRGPRRRRAPRGARAAPRARARPRLHAAHRPLRRRLRCRPRRALARRAGGATRTGSTSGRSSRASPRCCARRAGKIELAPEPIVDDVDAAPRVAGAHRERAARARRPARPALEQLVDAQPRDPGEGQGALHPPRAPRRRRTASASRTGATARVSLARRARSRSPVEVTDAIMPGVVSIPHGWGHDVEGVQMAVAGVRPGVNTQPARRRDADRPAVGQRRAERHPRRGGAGLALRGLHGHEQLHEGVAVLRLADDDVLLVAKPPGTAAGT